MTYQNGQTLYTQDGHEVQFDHVVGETAYVRPVQTVIIQSGYGERVDEYEDTEAASHLIAVNTASLYTTAPVAVFSDKIKAMRDEISQIAEEKKAALKSREDEIRALNSELAKIKSDLDRWNREHGVFKDIGRLLDGEPMFPLHSEGSPYHRAQNIPSIPKDEYIEAVRITYNRFKEQQPWTLTTSRDRSYPVRFFHTEEERAAHISEQFDEACDHFRKSPDFSAERHTHTTRLDYRTLQRWCKVHPHLSIPSDIEAAKAESDDKAVEAEKERLRKQLAEMETTT